MNTDQTKKVKQEAANILQGLMSSVDGEQNDYYSGYAAALRYNVETIYMYGFLDGQASANITRVQ